MTTRKLVGSKFSNNWSLNETTLNNIFSKKQPGLEATLKELLSDVNNLKLKIDQNRLSDMNANALNLLQPLLSHGFLPFSVSSMRPAVLIAVLNDILVNNRTRIIEFGTGISTVLVCRLIHMLKLNAKIVSVEHNHGWLENIEVILRREGLQEHAILIQAPLTSSAVSMDGNEWYDEGQINAEIQDMKFDQVIIDGPPAWEAGKSKSRYPALPFVYQRLAEKSSVFLDDYNRVGEREIVKNWVVNFKDADFKSVAGTAAVWFRGDHFSVDLML